MFFSCRGKGIAGFGPAQLPWEHEDVGGKMYEQRKGKMMLG